MVLLTLKVGAGTFQITLAHAPTQTSLVFLTPLFTKLHRGIEENRYEGVFWCKQQTTP